jgi:uncharacterized protein (DUF697 family)
MAAVDRAKSFWKTLKSVSVKEIAQEAQRPFSLAVVGEVEQRAGIMRLLFPGAQDGEVVPERSLVRAFDTASPEAGFPAESGSLDIVIDAGGGRESAPPGTPLYSLEELGNWERVAERILEQRPDLALSLARRFPGLRRQVADRIIRETALANAEFAMLNALPGVIPLLGPLLSLGAIGDIFMLTKNQAMMLFRLAAIHELPLDARARSRDLLPLLGNAFGWRALAREVVGVVPGGVGLAARGAIAYAGTVALGRALLRFYETGQQPTRAQINRFYKEAYAGARETVKALLKRRRAEGRLKFEVQRAGEVEEEKKLPPAPQD